MGKRILKDKSFDFAVQVAKIYKRLCEERKEFVLSKQLLRNGTSTGANRWQELLLLRIRHADCKEASPE